MRKSIEFLLIILIVSSASIEPIKVDIYYEALCSDSTRFITQQLYPVYNDLKDHLQIEFKPYGKATHNLIDNKWIFECQHGPNECIGNKYHSCALIESNNQDKQVAFVHCVMRTQNPASIPTIRACATREGFNWNHIAACGNSSVGDEMLAKNGDKTPSLSFVPTVIFENQFDATAQDAAMDGFAKVVCSKIHGNKPEIY